LDEIARKPRQADTADVGAQKVDDFAAIEPRVQRLGRDAHTERQHEAVVAAQHVIAELRRYQHQRDKERDEIPRIDFASAFPGAHERIPLRGGRVRNVTHGVNARAR